LQISRSFWCANAFDTAFNPETHQGKKTLTDQAAIISGGSRGLRHTTALNLSRRGVDIISKSTDLSPE